MIYLDTSAAVKLIHHERESNALATWINNSQRALVSSALIEVELVRAAIRLRIPDGLDHAQTLLRRVSRHEIDSAVREVAAMYPNPNLRSLDAIHLATAHVALNGVVTEFCCYDARLADVAREVGLVVVAPG